MPTDKGRLDWMSRNITRLDGKGPGICVYCGKDQKTFEVCFKLGDEYLAERDTDLRQAIDAAMKREDNNA